MCSNVVFEKKAIKYISSADTNTQKKLNKAITNAQNGMGDVRPLLNIKKHGHTAKGVWRIKIEHCRIFFKREGNGTMVITDIATKSNATYNRYGYM